MCRFAIHSDRVSARFSRTAQGVARDAELAMLTARPTARRVATARARPCSTSAVCSKPRHASVIETPCFGATPRTRSWRPSARWLSIITPVMRRSPRAIWPATSSATSTWRRWSLLLLPCDTSIITCSTRPAARSARHAASTCSASKLGRAPPRRITWQSSLPRVSKIAAMPIFVMPMKACGARAARIASAATLMLPSVPFLKPTGQLSPDASCRWLWLSVVRAPIAPQAIRSAMNCGLSRSRNSVPVGSPSIVSSSSSRRARSRPSLIAKLPSRCGSLM